MSNRAERLARVIDRRIKSSLHDAFAIPSEITTEDAEDCCVRINYHSAGKAKREWFLNQALAATDSIFETNFRAIYKTDLEGNPLIEDGFWIYFWETHEEKVKAFEAQYAIELESLLEIQKKVLARKEIILKTVKEFVEVKGESQEVQEVEHA